MPILPSDIVDFSRFLKCLSDINAEKSDFILSQMFVELGMFFDIINNNILVIDVCILKIILH